MPAPPAAGLAGPLSPGVAPLAVPRAILSPVRPAWSASSPVLVWPAQSSCAASPGTPDRRSGGSPPAGGPGASSPQPAACPSIVPGSGPCPARPALS
eukprot:12917630-Prorocentrum_lima.AAC.1